jgi:hypothetical protein
METTGSGSHRLRCELEHAQPDYSTPQVARSHLSRFEPWSAGLRGSACSDVRESVMVIGAEALLEHGDEQLCPRLMNN